jgi:hypothetical protein|tara:strand:+ start:176 stop:427 length:252 start_codon:yes stop_codon:yes gene_type:complete
MPGDNDAHKDGDKSVLADKGELNALHDSQLHSKKLFIHHIKNFYDQYEPEYYWFECLVILRKLMLTGLVALSKFKMITVLFKY